LVQFALSVMGSPAADPLLGRSVGRRTGWSSSGAWFGIASFASCALAYLLFFSSDRPLAWDSEEYWKLAGEISNGGLGHWASPLRTYGYPLFVAAASGFRQLSPHATKVAVFHVQLAVLLIAAYAAASRFGRIFPFQNSEPLMVGALVLNPVLLSHATECLSDSLGGSLVFLAVVCTLETRAVSVRSGGARSAAALILAGAATMVRPSNVTVLAVVAAARMAFHARRRELKPGLLLLLFAAAALPLLPQLAVNWRAYRKFQPLIVGSTYRELRIWGTVALKYTTSVIPGTSPLLPYMNPLSDGRYIGPREFCRERPVRCAATMALHGFAVVDHDDLFSYVSDLHPWYRWPVSVGNYVFLFLAGIGGATAARRAWRGEISANLRSAFLLLGAAILFYWLLHVPALVESRYGLPLDLLATPFAVFAVATARGWPSRRKLVATAAAVLFVAGSCLLSRWISAQRRVEPWPPSSALKVSSADRAWQ
jgi:hypothetical protein